MGSSILGRTAFWAVIVAGTLAGCGSHRLALPPYGEEWASPTGLPGLFAPPAAGDPRDHIYTIGPFDRLQISVWLHDDLSGERTVREDGTLYLPGAGAVTVEDLTLTEAQEALQQVLARILVEPQVQIEPIEIRSKVFSVLGAVRYPGRYPIFRSMTLQEVLALAGGVGTTTAGAGTGTLTRIYVHRRGEIYLVDLRSALMGQGPGQEWKVVRDDLIYIPDQQDARVFVLGRVNRPGPVQAAGAGLDLMAALAEAGGIRPGSQPREVGVMRLTNGRVEGVTIDLRPLLRGRRSEAAGLRLMPGDVVYVPRTALGAWSEVVAEIAPTLSSFVFGPLSAGRDYFLIRDLLDRR